MNGGKINILKSCKNDKKIKYNGHERSPRGNGYCAKAESIGKKRKGLDKNIWIIKSNKNKVKKWVIFKQIRKEPYEFARYYDQYTIKKGIDGINYQVTNIWNNKEDDFINVWKKLPNECVYIKSKEGRPSPPYAANTCKYVVMVGDNYKLYVSNPNKKKIFSWKKLKDVYDTKTPYEYFLQFGEKKKIYNEKKIKKQLKKLANELLKQKIYFIIVDWNKTGNYSDYAESNAYKKLRKILKLKKWDSLYPPYDHIINTYNLIYITPWGLYNALYNTGKLYFTQKSRKIDIYDNIFKKIFGKQYSWNKTWKNKLLVNLTK